MSRNRYPGRKPAAFAAALLALLLGLAAGCAKKEQGGTVEVGRQLPDFELPTLAGKDFERDDLLGQKPVILNFWATWCGPCRLEMPTLQELHKSGGARVVSIAVDDDGAAVVKPFVLKEGIPYEVLIGDSGTLERFGAFSIPYTLVLDRELKVRSIHRAVVSQRQLERELAELGP